jgi:6-phosphogluconate dehydrogenase
MNRKKNKKRVAIMEKQQIGVLGLAVMGKNLALNFADHGYRVAVFNRSENKTRELVEESKGKNIYPTYSLGEFVESLETPRKIVLMVKAGDGVEQTISQLKPLLAKGDILVDGGNSFYLDTLRRREELKDDGIQYIGAGISGGEEGARFGPSIMPGGSREAYALVEPFLKDISAKVEEDPCCTYIGEDGAGHFVKMVHNGIEYADMQLICEAYDVMKKVLGYNPSQMQQVFKEWNLGELQSYLIDITADILQKIDPDTGEHLVDKILDAAEQKGTGKWTSQVALDMGVAIPTITEAVFFRYLSALKEERVLASGLLKGPENPPKKEKEFLESIRRALFASKICAYAQGFHLMEVASKTHDWKLPLGDIAMIFRGGCIIRAQFLNEIKQAYEKNSNLSNLLLDDYFRGVLEGYQKDWREVAGAAISHGISIPGFSSALSYYDGYRDARLPMNLLQAQRDYFGAHTYRRTDKDGVFHTEWQEN